MKVEPLKNKNLINKFLKVLCENEKDFNQRRNRLLAKFMLNTGLRVSDVITIKYEDIYTSNRNFKHYIDIQEEKTDKIKRLKLNDSIKSELNEFTKDFHIHQGYIFKSQKDNYITRIQAYRVLKAAADMLNIENFGTHSLRKTWGYWTYKTSRYNIALIMDMFNHSSEKITLRYIGIDQEQQDELYSLVQF